MRHLMLALSLPFLLAATAHASEAVTGRVTLDPALADRANPTDTVFVFARAVTGPRVPLALVTARVSDLPLDYRLDDSLAMMPAMRLSGFDKVHIIARVSRAGSAMAASGDLEGMSPPVTPGTQGIDVVINKVLP